MRPRPSARARPRRSGSARSRHAARRTSRRRRRRGSCTRARAACGPPHDPSAAARRTRPRARSRPSGPATKSSIGSVRSPPLPASSTCAPRAISAACRSPRGVAPPAARTEVPAERRLAANLVICDVASRGPERLGRLLELGHRRHRADGQRRAVARDSAKPGVPQQQDTVRPEPSVVDLGHQDRAAAEHGYARAVAEGSDRLGPRRGGDDLGRPQEMSLSLAAPLLEGANRADCQAVTARGYRERGGVRDNRRAGGRPQGSEVPAGAGPLDRAVPLARAREAAAPRG